MNKTFKVILSLLLTFVAVPAFAEEVVITTETTTEAYVPPAEASNGVGGWAVVDPVTNIVHGVIVCTIDVCGPSGSWNGILPIEYMGCTNCNLRFQTNHTDDGNVAGYSGPDVKWNNSDKSFDMTNASSNSDGEVVIKRKLIPSKTASDGKRLETGIENIDTKFKSTKTNDSSVNIDMTQSDIDSPSSITVDYPAWAKFQYDSINSLKTNIELDVDAELAVRNESDIFIETIKTLTDKVKRFFGMILGGSQ